MHTQFVKPKPTRTREAFPFSTMFVDEYFFYPVGHDTSNARAQASERGRALRRKFTVHKTDSGRLKVTRIA